MGPNTADTFTLPPQFNPGMVERPLNDHDIESAVIPQEVRDGTLELGYDVAPEPGFWNVPERAHEIVSQPVIEEAGERKVPNAAAQVEAMLDSEKPAYAGILTHSLVGARHEALVTDTRPVGDYQKIPTRDDFTLIA